MKKRTALIHTPSFWVVRGLGMLCLCLGLLQIVHSISYSETLFKEGNIGVLVEYNAKESAWQLIKVAYDSPADRAGLRVGDLLQSVNGKKLNHGNFNLLFSTRGTGSAGSSIELIIKRRDKHSKLILFKELSPLPSRIRNILITLLTPVFMLVCIFLGLWAAFAGQSHLAKLVALICFTLSLNFIPANDLRTLTQLDFYYDLRPFLLDLSRIYFPALWILLFIQFPEPKSLFQKYKIPCLSLIFSFPVVYTAGMLWNRLTFLWMPKIPPLPEAVIGIYITLWLGVGLTMVISGEKRVTNILVKRQYNLLRFGLILGVLAMVLGLTARFPATSPVLYRQNPLISLMLSIFFILGMVGGMLLPLTMLNALFKHKLLETTTLLKRNLRYLLNILAVSIIYFVITFKITRHLVAALEVENTDTAIIIILMTALPLLLPALLCIRLLKDKIFAKDKTYRRDWALFKEQIPGFVDPPHLLEGLTQWMETKLKLQPVHPVYPPPADHGDNWALKQLQAGNIVFRDEGNNNPGTISLSVPMIYGHQLKGILDIGRKLNKDDFTGADLEIYREVAYQGAVALQNLELHADQHVKRRMARELETARRIQKQLLPSQVPQVEGMSISGATFPCHEVGGDYYDIIILDDKRAVLALADVSGKGAGAALLMANLQAALRTVFHLSHSLENITLLLNSLMCQNTAPNQFCTLFLAIWDARTRSLDYINAGHNPPILKKADGRVQKLTRTGLALGLMPEQTLKVEQLTLEQGDVLVIYSDGVEEAFNPDGDTFGLTRLIETVNADAGDNARELAEGIVKAVEIFSKNTPFDDDLTLLVGKITE